MAVTDFTVQPERTYAAYAEVRDGTNVRVSEPVLGVQGAHAAARQAALNMARRQGPRAYSERHHAGWVVYDGARFIAYVRAMRDRGPVYTAATVLKIAGVPAE